MKKSGLFCALLIVIFSSFKAPETKPTIKEATNKAEATFKNNFKDIQNVEWYSTDNTYSARFATNNVVESITYDNDGNFIRSRRSFGEEFLPANVLASIKKRYKGKTIRLVTEIVEGNELLYSLTIDDETNCWIVAAGPSGNNELLTTFKKQQ